MIMLIGSAGAMVGALLMFLQGGVLLHEAWHTVLAEGDAVQKQFTVPVLEAVDSFPFGIVLGDLRLWYRHRLRVHAAEGVRRTTAALDEGRWRGAAQRHLAEVVIVVLIVIFARIAVEANGHLQWSMLVLPASILLISVALCMIALGSKQGTREEDAGH
jgi:uncharacterized membrane protein YqhA